MMHTLLICGYGPAVGRAVAIEFGLKGHPIALIARHEGRLNQGVAELQKLGIDAQAFCADISDDQQLSTTLSRVRSHMGPIGILHWNAFVDVDGDLISTSPSVLQQAFNVRVTQYLTTIQTLLPDLKLTQGSILATNGIMAYDKPEIDSFAHNFASLAIPAAAQHKANGLLQYTLARHGIFIGEVIVAGYIQDSFAVKKHGIKGSINPTQIAAAFWQLHSQRTVHSIEIQPPAAA